MTRPNPKVSVLTPTYNRPRSLPDAIRSVVAQDMADWEMLVINDGGEDVGHIVAEAGDERVRYFNRTENRGKAACLNFGLERTRGKYIAYLDDDDIWYPHHLRTLACVLDDQPDIGVAYSDLYKTIALPTQGGRRVPLEKRVDICRNFNRLFMFHFNHTLHVSLMHRAKLVRRAGGYNEDVTVLIDWNLTRKLAFYTDFRHVQQVTGEYYIPVGGSDRITDVQREDRDAFRLNLRRIRADLPPEPWPKVTKVACVLPVRHWGRRTREALAYLADMLDYPCRIVVVNRDPARPRIERREALGELAELGNFRVIGVGSGADQHAAYAAGVEAVDAELYYLASMHLSTGEQLRLIRAVCYLSEGDFNGVRWSGDGDRGSPYDVLLKRPAAVEFIRSGGAPVPRVEIIPEEWIPPALETDYLIQFTKDCEANGNYRAAWQFVREMEGLQEGGTGKAYLAEHLSELAFEVGEYEPAERMCRELIGAGYGADNWLRLGQILQGREAYGDAADAYRRALECIGLRDEDLDDPAFPIASSYELAVFKALIGLGECLVDLGRAERAAPVLRRAARLCANSMRPWLAFGRLFLAAGDLEQAEYALRMARRGTEGEVNPDICGELAEVYERRGDWGRAFREWKRALAVAPSDYECLRGAVRAGEGRVPPEDMVGLYRQFLACRPGSVPGLLGLAELLLCTGQGEEAAALAERVLMLEPTERRALRILEQSDSSPDQRAAGA